MTCSIGSQIATNAADLDRKLTDSNDPFRASLLQWTELTSKNRRSRERALLMLEKYVTNVEF